MPRKKTSWIIEIPGPIVAYTRTTQRSKWSKRYQKYVLWKNFVRGIADGVGVPEVLDPAKRYGVYVTARYKKKPRHDIDNALKGAVDSLFAQDRQVTYVCANAVENCPEECMTITVKVRD